jgi:iron-sulfur cluster assembly accessory protein
MSMVGTMDAAAKPTGGTMTVQLTPKAIAMVKEEMRRSNLEGHALRIAVGGGGCSGYEYELDFAEDMRPGDIVAECDGLRVLIDEQSALYLQGTVIDYVDTFGEAGFKFTNPNAQKTCGCGTSFSV